MPELAELLGPLEFANAWAFWLLPLPLLAWLLPPYRETRDAVRAPFFDRLLVASDAQREEGAMVLVRRRGQQFLVLMFWLALVVAAARPQWLGEVIEQEKAGRDLMIAVDLSGSMEATDFTNEAGLEVDRLVAVKSVLERLVEGREGDRLGLIVFGDAAYLQSPFTEDHATWATLLDETRIRMAGPSTVLGDAIGLAIKLFEQSDTENRVLLVLTDGNDTGSIVPPIDAARVASTQDIRIYPIAIGDPASVGEDAIDTRTLDRVAEVTGGRSFTALDRQTLDDVFGILDALEPTTYDSVSFRPRTDMHWVPMLVAVLLYLALRLLAFLVDRPARRQALDASA
ncbi:MAG: VWA domain-containing protein [Pseudomonadota bacterium]